MLFLKEKIVRSNLLESIINNLNFKFLKESNTVLLRFKSTTTLVSTAQSRGLGSFNFWLHLPPPATLVS